MASAEQSQVARKSRILVICHEYPRPDMASSNRRLVQVLQLIAKSHQVDLFCPTDTKVLVEERYETLYRSMGATVHFGHGDALKRWLFLQAYEIFLFEWWITVPGTIDLVRRHQPWATVIVDAVDVCFKREEAAAALGRMDPAVVVNNRRREIEAYRGADAVLGVSYEDLATLKECGMDAAIYFVPNIEPTVSRSNHVRGREILFVGTFGINPANVDGVLWFVKEVWPRVLESVPDASLTLIGSHMTPEIQELDRIPGIEVAGFVADLEPHLDRAAVSIAPLRFGGGMKGKVTLAMSHGLPVVTTQFGAQGLDATTGEQILIADDADGFARGVIELLQDPEKAERIGRAGQALVSGLCPPEVVEGQVEAFLKWADDRNPRRSPPSILWWKTKGVLDRVSPAPHLKPLAKRVTPTFLWDRLKGLKRRIRGAT